MVISSKIVLDTYQEAKFNVAAKYKDVNVKDQKSVDKFIKEALVAYCTGIKNSINPIGDTYMRQKRSRSGVARKERDAMKLKAGHSVGGELQ